MSQEVSSTNVYSAEALEVNLLYKRLQNFQDRELLIHPLSHTGVDMFGPFIITGTGRNWDKVIWCNVYMPCKHHKLKRDRFIARYGNVKSSTSDNDTNFVGANNDLKSAFNKMNYQ